MATLARGGRIDTALVREETERLRAAWAPPPEARSADDAVVARAVGEDRAAAIDLFDRVQLAEVLRVCARSRSLSEAGPALFAESRARKTSRNDADRLKKYLARWDLTFDDARTAWRGAVRLPLPGRDRRRAGDDGARRGAADAPGDRGRDPPGSADHPGGDPRLLRSEGAASGA